MEKVLCRAKILREINHVCKTYKNVSNLDVAAYLNSKFIIMGKEFNLETTHFDGNVVFNNYPFKILTILMKAA